MNGEWLKNELISLERRLKVLLTQYSNTQKQKEQLELKNAELQDTVVSQKKAIESFENSLKFTHISEALQQITRSTEGKKEEIERNLTPSSETSVDTSRKESYVKLLNTYLTHLDQCIAYMEK